MPSGKLSRLPVQLTAVPLTLTKTEEPSGTANFKWLPVNSVASTREHVQRTTDPSEHQVARFDNRGARSRQRSQGRAVAYELRTQGREVNWSRTRDVASTTKGPGERPTIGATALLNEWLPLDVANNDEPILATTGTSFVGRVYAVARA